MAQTIPCTNWLSTSTLQSYAEVGEINVSGNTITVEAVFNRTTAYSGGLLYAGDLVSKHNTTNDVNYLLRPNNAEITTSNGYFRTPDICEIELNKTYHVAMVYDGTTLKFYRNGFLMSQVAATGNLIQNNWKTRIGFYEPQAVNTNFIGYINEVRIWKVEKSQAEIRTSMNTSLISPTTQPGLVAYFTFDNLLNKQGNTAYNGTLGGGASINGTNPNCALIIDSCAILSQPQTCNGSLGAPVVNITFGNGVNNPGPQLSTAVPGATTNYNFANYAIGNPPPSPIDGDYALLNQVPSNSAWYAGATDHTGDPNGYMAFFNAAPTPGEFYKQTILNLCPGTTYEFAAWVTNVINPAVLPGAVPPNITFNILDANTQAVLATYNTGDIAATNSFTWKQYSLLFTSPPGVNSVTLVLTNNNIGGTGQIGNDLAIDDITFKPCGPLTNASFSNTVMFDSTGTTNCSTINLFGKITGNFNSPSYQWQVSKNGGLNYADIPGATSLNINYANLNDGKYLFRMLSAESGNINSVNCRFISNIIILTVTGCPLSINKIINDYTPVVSLDPCTNKLTVEDGTKYNVGDTVVIMQMKGAVIDSSNTASFGTVTNYRNAGNYEFNYVKGKTGNVIELTNLLARQYDLPDGKVQLIRVPWFQDLVVTDTITCLPWDGKKGGVVVLTVKNNLTLNASVDVSGKGFKGGESNNPKNNLYYCHEDGYYYPNDQIKAAPKGEGITSISDLKAFGKGALANGGGGGLEHNSGGGGGSNASVGGKGGNEWITCGPPSANGGLGGASLSYSNASNKIFMGGGGGAGHCDNLPGFNPNGGAGGGIIMINAATITANSNSINANGEPGIECYRDGEAFKCHEGMGGGGGGGIIAIQCNSFSDNIIAKANGGKGADMNGELAGKLGPGGGGSGGACWLSTTLKPVNVVIETNGGVSGINIDFDKDNFGATPGQAGQNLFDLVLPVSTTPFKPNIDSVRITASATSCKIFDLKGIAYVNTAAIDKWDWFFDDGVSVQSGQNITHTYVATGLHPATLVVTDMNGCKDTVMINITVEESPPNPTYTIAQPTCANGFGSISINTPVGSNYQYSINGSTYQASPVFSNLPVGSYNLTVKNTTTNCLSLPINFNINAAAIPFSAQSNVTQPSCSKSFGTITVTAPLASELQYSIDNTNFQASTFFNNVTAGSYNVTVKNTTISCISVPVLIVINPPPAIPGLPVASTTQPVCNNDKGSISVTSPVGGNIEYSIDNTSFQSSVNFTNLSPASYNLVAKNITSGCTSVTANVVISAGTGTPSAVTGQVSKQPDCIDPTGAISINAPVGLNFSYSSNNSAYQTSTSFSNLASGNFTVLVKNISNGCISSPAQFTVNAVPTPPAAPGTVITQPTCAVITGAINITSPTGNNFQYSINNTAFQAGNSFTGLVPGSYSLTTKDISTQCISSASIAVVEVVSSPPSAPIIENISDPSCAAPKGTVEIASPTGSNFEYSINGTTFQASNKFINLDPGTYNFSVRNIATRCVSPSTPASVSTGPAAPSLPIANVTVQPSCIISEGTIVIASPSGSNYEYSIDGQTYQASATYTGLAPKTYFITAKDLTTGCISQTIPLTVVANTNSSGKYLMPTAFTPNGDAINECFGIKYWGVISEFQLIIYNRWGQTVFAAANPADCWDGMYKGAKASPGNYVYYIKAKTLCGPVEKKGNVMLVR